LGFEFSGAFSNVDDALSFISQNHINLVLSDIRLGEKSGLDLAKIMSETYPDILVVLISAYKEFEYAKKAIEYHVFSYLTKPTSYDDIINLFKSAKLELDIKIQNVQKEEPNSSSAKNSFEKALFYINAHFLEDITRENIASYLNMNPEYFSRFFKKNAGKKMVDYVNELRIEHAKALLSSSNMKIYQICNACCYKSMHYFLALFKQYTGIPVREYLRRHEMDVELDL
jgi:YesN/AraC family two-component response regulator